MAKKIKYDPSTGCYKSKHVTICTPKKLRDQNELYKRIEAFPDLEMRNQLKEEFNIRSAELTKKIFSAHQSIERDFNKKNIVRTYKELKKYKTDVSLLDYDEVSCAYLLLSRSYTDSKNELAKIYSEFVQNSLSNDIASDVTKYICLKIAESRNLPKSTTHVEINGVSAFTTSDPFIIIDNSELHLDLEKEFSISDKNELTYTSGFYASSHNYIWLNTLAHTTITHELSHAVANYIFENISEPYYSGQEGNSLFDEALKYFIISIFTLLNYDEVFKTQVDTNNTDTTKLHEEIQAFIKQHNYSISAEIEYALEDDAALIAEKFIEVYESYKADKIPSEIFAKFVEVQMLPESQTDSVKELLSPFTDFWNMQIAPVVADLEQQHKEVCQNMSGEFQYCVEELVA